jgi:hypothetical protein
MGLRKDITYDIISLRIKIDLTIIVNNLIFDEG